MISIFICLIIIVISFNFFMVSYQINGINRLVLAMPLSLFETAINLYEIDNEKGPAFNKNTLYYNLTSYFDYHIYNYTDEYSLVCYYYKMSDHSLDLSTEPQAVEITLYAKLVLNNQYKKSMSYEIRSN